MRSANAGKKRCIIRNAFDFPTLISYRSFSNARMNFFVSVSGDIFPVTSPTGHLRID